MPEPNARNLAARNIKRCSNGRMITLSVEDDFRNRELSQEQTVTTAKLNIEAGHLEEISSEKTVNNTLKYIELNDKGKRGCYSKQSATTKWRKSVEAKKIRPEERLEYFGFIKPIEESPQDNNATLLNVESQIEAQDIPHTQKETIKISEAIQHLKLLITPAMNRKDENSSVNNYQYNKFKSVYHYFLRRLEGMKKGQASVDAAEHIWPNYSKVYRPKIIISWEKEFLEYGTLFRHCQGKHVKR
jgi:hypothetical protein